MSLRSLLLRLKPATLPLPTLAAPPIARVTSPFVGSIFEAEAGSYVAGTVDAVEYHFYRANELFAELTRPRYELTSQDVGAIVEMREVAQGRGGELVTIVGSVGPVLTEIIVAELATFDSTALTADSAELRVDQGSAGDGDALDFGAIALGAGPDDGGGDPLRRGARQLNRNFQLLQIRRPDVPIQFIDVGQIANDGTGDTLRDMGMKLNANFAALDAQAPVTIAALAPIVATAPLEVPENAPYGTVIGTIEGFQAGSGINLVDNSAGQMMFDIDDVEFLVDAQGRYVDAQGGLLTLLDANGAPAVDAQGKEILPVPNPTFGWPRKDAQGRIIIIAGQRQTSIQDYASAATATFSFEVEEVLDDGVSFTRRRSRVPVKVLPVAAGAIPKLPAPNVHLAAATRGTGDGSSWANAIGANSGTATNLFKAAAPGTVFGILADEVIDVGAANISFQVNLAGAAGYAANPVVLQGMGRDYRARKCWLRGTRRRVPLLANPDTVTTGPGRDDKDAGNNVLAFVGTGGVMRGIYVEHAYHAFRQGGDLHSPSRSWTIEDWAFWNIAEGIRTTTSQRSAPSLIGSTIRRGWVMMHAKYAIRLMGVSRDTVVQDLWLDSRRIDGDPFPVGVAIEDWWGNSGTPSNAAERLPLEGGERGSHHITVERVVSHRCHHNDGTGYWNGDGFSDEGWNHDNVFRDCRATGHTDAAFDCKGKNVLIVRPLAYDNKRDFRLWDDWTIDNRAPDGSMTTRIFSATPRHRGGSGGRLQLWSGGRGLQQLFAPVPPYAPGEFLRASDGLIIGGRVIDHVPGGKSYQLGESTNAPDAGGGCIVRLVGVIEPVVPGAETILSKPRAESQLLRMAALQVAPPALTTSAIVTIKEGALTTLPLAFNQPVYRYRYRGGDLADFTQRDLRTGPPQLQPKAYNPGGDNSYQLAVRVENASRLFTDIDLTVNVEPLVDARVLDLDFRTGTVGQSDVVDTSPLANPLIWGSTAIGQDEFGRGWLGGSVSGLSRIIRVNDIEGLELSGPFTIIVEDLRVEEATFGTVAAPRSSVIACKAGDTFAWILQVDAARKLSFLLSADGAYTNASVVSAAAIAADTRYPEIRVTRDAAGLVTMYVGGQVTGTPVVFPDLLFDSTFPVAIGGRGNGLSVLNGMIGGVTIHRGKAIPPA